jgi:Na+(H+)/acetate symporter ActP
MSTVFGLGTLLGSSEWSYWSGIQVFVAYGVPHYILYMLMAYVGPRIRELGGRSFVEIIGNRYGNGARVMAALSSFFYSIQAMEVMAMGFICGALFGVPKWIGMLVGLALGLACGAMCSRTWCTSS